MQFLIRRVGNVFDVRIAGGGTVIDLGLLDDRELSSLIGVLEEGVDELTECVRMIKPKNKD